MKKLVIGLFLSSHLIQCTEQISLTITPENDGVKTCLETKHPLYESLIKRFKLKEEPTVGDVLNVLIDDNDKKSINTLVTTENENYVFHKSVASILFDYGAPLKILRTVFGVGQADPNLCDYFFNRTTKYQSKETLLFKLISNNYLYLIEGLEQKPRNDELIDFLLFKNADPNIKFINSYGTEITTLYTPLFFKDKTIVNSLINNNLNEEDAIQNIVEMFSQMDPKTSKNEILEGVKKVINELKEPPKKI